MLLHVTFKGMFAAGVLSPYLFSEIGYTFRPFWSAIGVKFVRAC